jgi:hypothetical protein
MGRYVREVWNESKNLVEKILGTKSEKIDGDKRTMMMSNEATSALYSSIT